MPDGVVQYIAKHDLYPEKTDDMTATDHALELVRAAARAASDKLAQQIVAFDVSEQLAITDAFVLASATNDRQVKAIVDEVEDKLREIGAKPIRREGERDGRWVLIDYGEIVVHVQHEEERQFYALERLWRDCPVIELPGRRHLRWLRPPAHRRLVLLRHGQTAWNAERRAQGHSDVPLDDVGPRAGRRGGAVRRGGCGRGSSGPPTWRAPGETAERVAAARRRRACVLDPRLREYDLGERTGITMAEYAAAHPEEYRAFRAGRYDVVPGGETTRAGRRPGSTACVRRRAGRAGAGGVRRRWSGTAPRSRCRCWRSWAGPTSCAATLAGAAQLLLGRAARLRRRRRAAARGVQPARRAELPISRRPEVLASIPRVVGTGHRSRTMGLWRSW